MFKSKLGKIGFGVAIGILLVMVAWQVLAQNYTYQGSLIDPPVMAEDFELIDQHNNSFRLSDQRGKVVLIFFGYTHCPDVCPVTLSEFKQVKSQLKGLAENVEFVFVTVDPERDSPEHLSAYLRNFDPEFVGLSGEQTDLEEVWRNFGVYAARQDTDTAAGYLVDHTARVYAIDTHGNWRLTYPYGMEIEKIYQDVRHLIREE